MDGRWRGRLVAGLVGAAVLTAVACSGTDDGVKPDPTHNTDTPATTGDPPVVTGNTGGNVTPQSPSPTDAGPGGSDQEQGGDEHGDDNTPPPPPPDPTVDTGKPQTEFKEVAAETGGWTFYSQAEGAPSDVFGVSEDEGGNLWVAGGTEGLFLLRKGATRFERFGMENGLQPYGLWKGKVPVGEKLLDVRSVQGGPAGVVWVGYQGLPNCEAEFYKEAGQFEDPNVFKSGDADRVELKEDGTLRVIHYDLSSIEHTVPGYGHREKICSVYRIVWDKARNSIWFAGNHGFSWGEANYQGGTSCSDPEVLAGNQWTYYPTDGGTPDERQRCVFGVMEHVHPGIFSPPREVGWDPSLIAGDVMGMAVKPDGDVWFTTAIRTSLFRIMTNAAPRFKGDAYVADGAPWDFEAARKLSADKGKWKNRIDVWTDADAEPMKDPFGPNPNGYFSPDERKDDNTSGLALMSDGTVWVSSYSWGLAQLDANGAVVRRLFEGTSDSSITALGRDTRDESLWFGLGNGNGLSRLQGDKLVRYEGVLSKFGKSPVWDLQFVGTGESRRMLVGFRASGRGPGGIGIYTSK